MQKTQTTGKPNYGKTNHPLLLSATQHWLPLAASLSQEGLIPDRCCCPPCALPAQPQLPRDFTAPEYARLLLGKAPSHCPAERAVEKTECRQLSLCHLALFTLSNTQPNSHIKLQQNQLGPLSHGINQKSCHIKKPYEISRQDKGRGKLKGSSCAGHLKTSF